MKAVNFGVRKSSPPELRSTTLPAIHILELGSKRNSRQKDRKDNEPQTTASTTGGYSTVSIHFSVCARIVSCCNPGCASCATGAAF
jgi:hypothetical protein